MQVDHLLPGVGPQPFAVVDVADQILVAHLLRLLALHEELLRRIGKARSAKDQERVHALVDRPGGHRGPRRRGRVGACRSRRGRVRRRGIRHRRIRCRRATRRGIRRCRVPREYPQLTVLERPQALGRVPGHLRCIDPHEGPVLHLALDLHLVRRAAAGVVDEHRPHEVGVSLGVLVHEVPPEVLEVGGLVEDLLLVDLVALLVEPRHDRLPEDQHSERQREPERHERQRDSVQAQPARLHRRQLAVPAHLADRNDRRDQDGHREGEQGVVRHLKQVVPADRGPRRVVVDVHIDVIHDVDQDEDHGQGGEREHERGEKPPRDVAVEPAQKQHQNVFAPCATADLRSWPGSSSRPGPPSQRGHQSGSRQRRPAVSRAVRLSNQSPKAKKTMLEIHIPSHGGSSRRSARFSPPVSAR